MATDDDDAGRPRRRSPPLPRDPTSPPRSGGRGGSRAPSLRERARQSWRMIRRRAVDPRLDSRLRHGVCAAWLAASPHGLRAFLADVGLPPSRGHVLVRRSQDLPWGPTNAYWTLDRSRLRTPPRHLISAFGYVLSISQWAAAAGISSRLLYYRLLKMPPQEALTRPVQGYRATQPHHLDGALLLMAAAAASPAPPESTTP